MDSGENWAEKKTKIAVFRTAENTFFYVFGQLLG